MQNKGHIKILQRFLHEKKEHKQELADFLELKDKDTVYKWVQRGALPKARRKWILEFMNERLRA